MAKGLFNPFILKKWAALLFAGLFSTIGFAVGLIFYGFWWGIGIMFITLLVGAVAGNLLLKNPFSAMLEGKGILTLNIDSTGVIRPFVVGVAPPYINGKLGNKGISDIFDRATVNNLAPPKVVKLDSDNKAERKEDGGIHIDISEKQYNEGRFAFFHYPTLIYNQQIDTIVTKDFIADKEKDTFAEHGVLFLNRKMEELTSVVRDFGRYVVEMTKPKDKWFQSKWVWIIVVILVIILIIMFAPSIMNAVGGTIDTGGFFTGAANNAVTPIT